MISVFPPATTGIEKPNSGGVSRGGSSVDKKGGGGQSGGPSCSFLICQLKEEAKGLGNHFKRS